MDVVKTNLEDKNCPQLREVTCHVTKAKKCVVITGAGISTSGGIPDFRNKEVGLYEQVKRQFPGIFRTGKDLFDGEMLTSHEALQAFNLFMGTLKELIVSSSPTTTHYFLKKLADMKKLTRVYTQNVDNLEESAGLKVDWKLEKITKCSAQVVQLHGTMARLRCTNCTNNYPFEIHYCNIFKQGEAPWCPNCEQREDARLKQGRRPHSIGKLKPMVLLYGDEHPNGYEISQLAAYDEAKADCLIIMGTSLKIPGVKALIKNFSRAVHDRGGYVILINKSDVVRREWNGIIDYQIEGTCDDWVRMIEDELAKMDKKRHPKDNSIDGKIRVEGEGNKLESRNNEQSMPRRKKIRGNDEELSMKKLKTSKLKSTTTAKRRRPRATRNT
ncbi:hypothetical protein Glove_590g24 [Diversispora epigaea]|uniref:Deacetylase sirtuin-type domain-containing protein n=1 Tax=Diversispora epigaea TaxID=1348612 RepID=A0A397GB66_9GLOM|nr:hypothetical protein Glove_590g24 [Diversispora epigaea]